jgi:hypothetical protein
MTTFFTTTIVLSGTHQALTIFFSAAAASNGQKNAMDEQKACTCTFTYSTYQTSFRTVGTLSFVGLTELLILNPSVHLYAHHEEYTVCTLLAGFLDDKSTYSTLDTMSNVVK